MKVAGFVIVAAVLVAMFQPWSYDHRGFANVSLQVPGGVVALNLDDHVRGETYCLTSTFSTNDAPGETVSMAIDRISTTSVPALKTNIEKSGTTFRIEGVENSLSYFAGPGAPRLIFPTDEAVTVSGSIRYKGVDHRFQMTMKLRHWEKSRKMASFCA